MNVWQAYERQPLTHPTIPYIASAGYRLGATPPDLVAGVNVLDFGASAEGRHDSADAINRAITSVGASGGGVVHIPEGRYVVDDLIRVSHSNVVVKGAGSGRTTLVCRTPLEELVGVSGSRFGGEKSAWSWSGGLVWVCSSPRLDRILDNIRRGSWPREGWLDRVEEFPELLGSVTVPARRGDFTVTVDSSGALHAGQRAIMLWDDGGTFALLRHMCGDIAGAESYPWHRMRKLLSYLPYAWPVRIDRVEGDRVLLRQPLPLDVDTGWKVRLVAAEDPICEAGVEGLTMELPAARMTEHLRDRGFNGIAFQCAWDCWCRDIVIKGGENGLLLVSSKGVTVSDTQIVGANRHHSYVCREQSHDNLFSDFRITRAGESDEECRFHHGINVEGLSSGNVWRRGRMQAGAFDSHRGLPFANVRTRIEIHNDGWMSGSRDAGPRYGARFVHWNISVTNGHAKGIRIDRSAPYSTTAEISGLHADGEPESDFEGDLAAVYEPPGPGGGTVPDLYDAQRGLIAGCAPGDRGTLAKKATLPFDSDHGQE
ncbi:glycosyl hydrolase family 28-related protein [Nonomuraea sp. NPDC050202]|uniref:glycosyl hydrolase family 28-related protein n=1 Tax=Nonomuraea sp. NPDC050202 TaxID=3155035 RepID=UPI0033E32472